MMADWLQGPYLYRLYAHYGYLEDDIATLYIVGFSSSMLGGPLLGGLADKYGRKRCVDGRHMRSVDTDLMAIGNTSDPIWACFETHMGETREIVGKSGYGS